MFRRFILRSSVRKLGPLMCDQEVGSCGFVHADCSACCWRSGRRSRSNRCWVLPVICAKSLQSATSQATVRVRALKC